MHLLLRVRLSSLPQDAQILVVGAGTGAEVRVLAPLFPGWRFTLVDPAPAMLAIARQHALAAGFADRCVFHEGFIDSAPKLAHHAAISVLVSHFLTDTRERCAFFEEIAARLRPGAPLFNADLSAELDGPDFDPLMELWIDMLGHSGPVDPAGVRQSFGRMVAAHGPTEVARIIQRAGFGAPAACFQMALVRGWVATRD